MDNNKRKVKVPMRTTVRKITNSVDVQQEFIEVKSELNSRLRLRYKELHKELAKEVLNNAEEGSALTKTKVVEIVNGIRGYEVVGESTSKFLTKIFAYFKIDKIQVLPVEDTAFKNQKKIKRKTIFESHMGREVGWLQNSILKELFIQTNNRIDNKKNNSRYQFSHNTGAFLVVCVLYDKVLSCLFSNKYIDENLYFDIGEEVECEDISTYFKQRFNEEINVSLIMDTIYLLADAYIFDSAKHKDYGQRDVVDEVARLFYKKIWD